MASSNCRYLIGPLDVVNIIVWGDQKLSMNVGVRPDGIISTPLVEDMPALGRNPSDLEKALSKNLRSGRHGRGDELPGRLERADSHHRRGDQAADRSPLAKHDPAWT